MSIKIYRDQPFDVSTEVDLVDLFAGDGITDAFTLTNKSGLRLGASIQFDNIVYYRYNGGYTLAGDTFTLSSIPAPDTVGVAPGLNCITINAFDTDTVSGVTDPRVDEVAFYLGNGTDIYLEYYTGLDDAGIQIQFSDLIVLSGQPDSTWLQLSSSTQDEAGTAAAYQVTGEAIYTPPISAFATLTTGVTSLSTSLSISSTDTWVTGDYILINPGGGNSEIVKIVGQSGSPANTLLTTELNYNHSSGEAVYACARKFWAKLTVPLNATGGQALNFLNVALNVVGKVIARF